jgi:hypothetical protein
VHFVVPELDAGTVIMQAVVPVLAGDTPDTLAARVLQVEHPPCWSRPCNWWRRAACLNRMALPGWMVSPYLRRCGYSSPPHE